MTWLFEVNSMAMFALADKWVWDFWFARSGNLWHLYFLQADKALGDPELRHWNATHGHAVSSDLRDWDYLGTCLAPSPAPAWDDKAVWTGSVVQDDDGLWHLFYTGSSIAEDAKKQRIGHATAADMHHWRRVGGGLALDIDARFYEEFAPGHWHDRAMRDPWVMRDPDGDGWIMYYTARIPGVAEPNAGGAIGLARSSDLLRWTACPPVFAGGFGQLEVPQILRIGDKWYCLFCTNAEHWSEAYRASYPGAPVTGTHYLISDSHLGPWQIAPGPFLDGHLPPRRYAGKIVQLDDGLAMLGFLHDGPRGEFIGAVSDPIRIETNSAGLFHPLR